MRIDILYHCFVCNKETKHEYSFEFPDTKVPILCSQCGNIKGMVNISKLYCQDDLK